MSTTTNQTTATPECYPNPIAPTYFAASNILFYLTYYAIAPYVNLFMGLALLAMLRAFYIESKSERAYWYQIFLTACDCVRHLCVSFYDHSIAIVGFPGYELSNPAAVFLRSHYGFMVVKSNLASPLVNALGVACLLFSVSISVDRVMALKDPLGYKSANHRARQMVCLISCLAIGFGSTIYDCFRWKVVMTPGESSTLGIVYKAALDQAYTASSTYVVCNTLRNVIRFGAWGLLILANLALLYLYNARMKKSLQIRTSIDDQKVHEANKKQRVLLIMTISQSIKNTLNTFSLMVWYMILAFYPAVNKCGTTMGNELLDCVLALAPMAEFLVMIAVSKSYRQMLRKGIGKAPNQVTSIVVNSSHGQTRS